MEIILDKGEDLNGKIAETAIIKIEGVMPVTGKFSLLEINQYYKQQADSLYKALRKSLPQGTRYQLLIRLLQDHRIYYRGV